MTWGLVPKFDYNAVAVAGLIEIGLVALVLYGFVEWMRRKDTR